MPLLLYISTAREYGRFRSNWVSFSLTGAIGRSEPGSRVRPHRRPDLCRAARR